MDEDAIALAQNLDRAHARARAAEHVLGEDRLRRSFRVTGRERGDEAGDVDVRRASDDTRRRRVRATALEAPVGLDACGVGRQGPAELTR